jgi:hypothetical protein
VPLSLQLAEGAVLLTGPLTSRAWAGQGRTMATPLPGRAVALACAQAAGAQPAGPGRIARSALVTGVYYSTHLSLLAEGSLGEAPSPG